MAVGAPEGRTRLNGWWTLDCTDAVEPALVTKALEDSSRDVRVSAVRIAERWLKDEKHPIQPAVLKKIDDTDWAVRRQLAASLGALPEAARIPALTTLLERHGDAPITVDAAVSGLQGSDHAVLQRLLAAAEETPQRTGAAVVLAATLVRGGEDARVQELFQLAAAPRPRPRGCRRRSARHPPGRSTSSRCSASTPSCGRRTRSPRRRHGTSPRRSGG